MGRSRSKRGSSSSTSEEGAADTGSASNTLYGELKDSIECLKTLVTEGLADIREDLDKLRREFKSDIKAVNSTIKELEQSLNSTQGDVDILKKQFKTESEEQISEMELLRIKIAELEQSLKEEVERNTNLEQNTRRGNLRFDIIKESEDEDCKEVVYNIIERDLGIRHLRNQIPRRCRPIIARFVCAGEDRDQVWFKRGKIKKSRVYTDVYITEDYARAIQKEREILVKAMTKAHNEHNLPEAKVKDRFLYINGERFDFENVPERLLSVFTAYLHVFLVANTLTLIRSFPNHSISVNFISVPFMFLFLSFSSLCYIFLTSN